ncbi:MAG: beta-ketoacyl-ACP synthase [Cellvibrionaceae bacterium]
MQKLDINKPSRKTIPVYLNDLGIICSLGSSKKEIAERLFYGCRGGDSSTDSDHFNSLTMTEMFTAGRSLSLGQVNTQLPSVDHLPIFQQTRSNQLLIAALNQIEVSLKEKLAKINPLRVGVVLGVSTSGIREGEKALAIKMKEGQWPKNYQYEQQEMSSPAESLADWLNIQGPAMTISTACSSGAKALASARRLLRNGGCDLVIAGGVDALCQLTVSGFAALESVSDEPCVPFSKNRRGINIGEGAALFVMTREPGAVLLNGVGETSDAHHISAPAPDGRGAIQAINLALKDAGVERDDVRYANLHGTATEQNDKMESKAIHHVFGHTLACSSTKGFTGHTLGAAGAIEAGFCWLSLMQNSAHELQNKKNSASEALSYQLPIHQWDDELDDTLPLVDLVVSPRSVKKMRHAISNSFAFGGNNICLLISKK